MANRNPKRHPENLRPWPPGRSGNPDGSSRKQRIASALGRFLDARKKRADELAVVIFAMATGRRDLLPGKDEPDLDWFRELCSILGEYQPKPSRTEADPAADDIVTLREFLGDAQSRPASRDSN